MSWSPDLFIGELRPWPDSVHVVRGKTDEARRYTPERKDGQEVLERRIDELCQENERLHAAQAHWELGNCPSCPNIADLQEALEQNAKLREYITKLEQANIALDSDNTELRDDMRDMQMFVSDNAKLREQMERLVTLLRNDCDIEASWDGLRRFWSIELTEGGCLMRDRACKAEAENAKLRRMNEAMWLIIRCASGEVSARDGLPVIHEDDIIMLRNMRRDLRIEVPS